MTLYAFGEAETATAAKSVMAIDRRMEMHSMAEPRSSSDVNDFGRSIFDMKQLKVAILTLIAALGAAPAVLASKTPTQAELQKEAKIPMEKAREIALKQVP